MYLNPPSSREIPYNFSVPMVNNGHEKEGEAFKVLRKKVKTFPIKIFKMELVINFELFI